jgi:bifunctional enzyme CysN/CysC
MSWLVVNKIDLVDYDQAVFDRIVAEYRAFAEPFGFKTLAAVPVSALRGDNILAQLARIRPGIRGSALVPYLETVDITEDRTEQPFRFPVQWVNRPNLDFRGFSGTVASGPGHGWR